MYKTLIRPLMEYPVIPNATASKMQLKKMQVIQNKNIKFATNNDDIYEGKTLQERHEMLGVEPLNTRMFYRLEKVWNKFSEKEEELYRKSERENMDNFKDHLWWKRAALTNHEGPPQEVYV